MTVTSETVVTTASSSSAGMVADGASRRDAAHIYGAPVTQATTPELVGRIVNNVSDLVDKQLLLAKQELGENLQRALGAAKTLAIGGGIAAVAALLLLIWAWTGLIWFFNWLGDTLLGAGWIGWPIGLLIIIVVGFVAYRFIMRGIGQIKFRPLERTRGTLREDLEWVKTLRTPSGR